MKTFPNRLLSLFLLALSCGRPQEAQTLRWWHFWAEPYQKPVVQELIREFESQHKGVTIEASELTWQSGHDKIATAFAANRAPDVVELGSDWIYEFASRSVLRDVTQETDALLASHDGWALSTLNGRRYAYPWLLGTRALFVNRRLVPDADSIRTWPQLLRAVQSAHRPEEERYGFGSTKREPHQLYKKFLPFFWTAGGDVVDSSGAVSVQSEANLRALNFYLELCKHGLLESQKILDERFTEGRIGVVISGGWLLRKIELQNPSLDYAVISFPGESEQDRGISFFGGQYLAVNAQSERSAVAQEFIRFLLGKDRAMRLSVLSRVTVPSDRSAAADSFFVEHPGDRVLLEQLRHARPSPLHPQWPAIERILEDEVEQALYGKKTSADCLRDADERIRKIL